jgi:hypothetical protein
MTVVFSARLAYAAAKPAHIPATITIIPALDNSLLINPGKGFVEYDWANPIDTPTYIGIGYSRFNWSSIEPRDGVFDWKPIDDFIAQFGKYGKKVSFGVMNVSTGVGCQYVTPKWVFDDGASAFSIPDSSTPSGTQIIPRHWDDPIFLSKMHAFVAALGRRYDGNPNIEFVDIRSYGNWGEGHIGELGGAPAIVLTPPVNLKKNYFQPYFDAFSNTQLIVPWGVDIYDGIYDWAVSKGAGMRRDGILSQWSNNGVDCLRAYGHAPAVFEYCWDYKTTIRNGYWSTANLWKSVETGKPSFMEWDSAIFADNHDFILALGNKIGYHFVLQKAVVPGRLHPQVPFRVRLRWLNDGVAPVYKPCFTAIALLDQHDNVVQKQWLNRSDPRTWMPNTVTNEDLRVTFAAVPAGSYKLAVGLFLSKRDDEPEYRLGVQGRTDDGWYILAPTVGFTRH